MRPLICRGRDLVTVVPVYRKLKKGDIVIFERNDGVYVCHRIWKIKGDTVATIGDACVGFDMPIKISQVWGIVAKKKITENYLILIRLFPELTEGYGCFQGGCESFV